ARRNMKISAADNGTEKPTMKTRQSRVSPIAATCVPGKMYARRQPSPLAPSQSAKAGNGSSAQARDRSGRLNSNAANAAAAAVAAEPTTASHMSGVAIRRCHIAARLANAASAAASATTSASQMSARNGGDHKGRTGCRFAAKAPISRSCGRSRASAIVGSGIELQPQRLERPVQVDLERTLAAAGQCRGIVERFFLQHEMAHSVALALRQLCHGGLDPSGVLTALDSGREVHVLIG